MRQWLRPSLNWLLVFVPVSIGMDLAAPSHEVAIFLTACVAIIPLAGWMGKATEHLAARTGEGVGGLLNATFGNAAELIIALVALRKGLDTVVKASLAGSIIGNILLVMGAAFVAGGLRFRTQQFNPTGARVQSTMLMLAAIALVIPAAFHHLGGPQALAREADLSLEIAIVLLITYGLGLLFSLHTHKQFFAGHAADGDDHQADHGPAWSIGRSLAVLLGATAMVAWISEVLVGSVEHAAHAFGMTNVFIGIIVVAVIGNAAEHSTAILFAVRNRMDLSIGIAIGSSIQIALFAAPVLLLASYAIAPKPMNLVFSPAEVLAVVMAAVITAQIAGDGESNWLEGVQLLSVYALLGIVFYFLPESQH